MELQPDEIKELFEHLELTSEPPSAFVGALVALWGSRLPDHAVCFRTDLKDPERVVWRAFGIHGSGFFDVTAEFAGDAWGMDAERQQADIMATIYPLRLLQSVTVGTDLVCDKPRPLRQTWAVTSAYTLAFPDAVITIQPRKYAEKDDWSRYELMVEEILRQVRG